MKNICNKPHKLIGIILSAILFLSIIPFPASAYVDTVVDFTYDFNDTNYTAIVREYKGTAENVTVPATVSYLGYTYTVTEMTDVFKNNTTVKSVTVSNGIKSIDYYSFLNCTNLTSVTIPESVAKIGTGAFDGCSSLKTLVLPQSVTNIGGMAFRNCNNLTTLILPNGLPNLTPVERNAFENTAITDVFVRNGVNFTEYIDNKFPQSALSNTVKIWRYEEQGKTDVGKTKVSIDSVKDKDGNDWSDNSGIILANNKMSSEYVIESVDQAICFYENLVGGESKDPKEWTVYGEHNYDKCETDSTHHWHECICGNRTDKEEHDWAKRVSKNVTDTEFGEMIWKCNVCSKEKPQIIPPLKENQDMLLLNANETYSNEQIKCIVQDPYSALPNDAILNIKLSEGVERLNNKNNLDNTHKIEYVEFFEITLRDSTYTPINQTNFPVRVLLQIPNGWDKADMEAVLIKEGNDVEFNEIIVTLDNVEYVAFWTDHFSPYAIIDKFTQADKKTPTIDSEPTVSRVIIGNTLSTSILTGGVASVDGKFEWKDGTEVLDSKGTVQKAVVFTPNDTENYNTVKFDVDVTVVICDTASGEHDYAEQKTNVDEHWTVCAKCGVEKNDSREVHKGGTATCTAKAKCSVCGEEYSKMLDHKYEWVIDKEPTATEEGLKHEECTVCKAKQNENTAISKTETNSPQTGDNSNMALMYALLFISGMGLVATTLYGRKKRTN